MNKVCMELKMKTPLLYSVLMTIAIPAGKHEKPIDWTPSVAVAAAILLKQRNKLVNSVQIVMMMLIKYNGFHVCITIKCINLFASIPQPSLCHSLVLHKIN